MKQQPTPPRVGYFPEQSNPPPKQPPRRRVNHPISHVDAPLTSNTATPPRQPSPPVYPTAYTQSVRTPKPKAKLRISPRLLMLCACITVFLVSGFLLVRYFSSIVVGRRASRQLETVYSAAMESTELPTATPSPTPTAAAMPTAAAQQATAPAVTPSVKELWPDKYPENPLLRVSSVFYELQRQNADIVGWLKIDGVLEEAVVQRDNEYYLTHNALKQRSLTGALFLDESCNLRTVPSQMLIHGHNMKEGAMFGSLKKYKVKDASFYRAHPYIDFNTIYENGRYVIFAVSEVDIRYGKHDYLPFWRDVRFSNAETFTQYVNTARTLSQYRCNVDVQPGDRLLTLSTCTGSDDNKRLIIMARKIREGEDTLQLNMSILSTDDR